jgi:hypothetical protein
MRGLYARSQLVQLGEVDVRILGPEDHLRLLCLHLLRHGADRPLWLCDIGVALESRPADFDWDYCMSGSRRRSEWVACALGLAHHLLGARLDNVPAAWRAYNLPHWLVPAVLRQWARESSRPSTLALADLRHPGRVFHQLREHWPNPIEATMRLRGKPNNVPRLPIQLGDYLLRAFLSGARLERWHAKLVGHQW